MVRTSAVVGLAILGLAAYKFLAVSKEALPDSTVGASIVAEDIKLASGPKAIVDNLLKTNRVVIFSKSYCGFSLRAKQVLSKHLGGGFKTVELDQREDGPDIQNYMLEITGGRTVPRVFIDGKFIGGSDDAAALDRSGKLAEMFKSKGIVK